MQIADVLNIGTNYFMLLITVALGATLNAGTTSIKFGTTPIGATINGTFIANTTGLTWGCYQYTYAPASHWSLIYN